MKKIINLLKKYDELIRYLFIGICTTLVSLSSYYILIMIFLDSNKALELQIANIISWILSVSFAFITNKFFVFRTNKKNTCFEIFKFFESRLLTLIIDIVFMFIMVTLLKIDDKIAKLLVQFIIFILNYLFSKFMVFKKEKK